METKIYKGLLLLTLGTAVFTTTQSAHAFTNRIYVGAMAGYSEIDTPDSNVFGTGSPATAGNSVSSDNCESDTGGFGFGAFAGFDFNKYFAIEFDYVKYAESEYKSTQSEYSGSGSGSTKVGTSNASIDYDTYSLDVYLKGTLPFQSGFALFAKVGAAYVQQEVKYSNSGSTPSIPVDTDKVATPESGSNTYSELRPAGAIGAEYHFNKNFSMQLIAQGFVGDGDLDGSKDNIATAYIVGLAATIRFA
ncbi:MAG: outer membrane beta-barrel protein [Gammaproteobacteria bacterium]